MENSRSQNKHYKWCEYLVNKLKVKSRKRLALIRGAHICILFDYTRNTEKTVYIRGHRRPTSCSSCFWHNEKQLKILKRVKIPGDKKLNRHFWKRRAKHVFPFICEVILEHPVIQTELCQLGEKKCYQKIRKKSSEKTLLIKGW